MSSKIPSYNTVAMGAIGGIVPAFGDADQLGMMNFLSNAFRGIEDIMQGMVITYNPNTHSASVLVFGAQSIWTCVFSDEPISFSFGFSSTHPVREGELVLVCRVSKFAHAGIIIGRIGYPLCFADEAGADLYKDPDFYHRRLYTQDDKEKKTWDMNVDGMMKPLGNQNDNSTHISTHFRPTDVYPGEFANVNQHNCGIKGGMFSSTLLGGGASLRLSALTNSARLTCEHYIRNSMHGTVHEFHNGRYLSSERNFSIYQEERLGGNSPGASVWEDDAVAPVGGERQTMRPRIKDLTGYFGNLSARFCLRPDPNLDSGSVRVLGDGSPIEEGVSRETIDPSGQYRLSAAGMIALERTGRIPVPVRNSFPTDKGHDISSDPDKLIPFEHDTSDPAYRQLELFDRQAYDLKNQYSRVDGLGLEKSDYDVPQEEDMNPLEDSYDREFFGNETVKLSRYDRRRAGAYIGEDGSIILRDAWGSEIVMLGGNVSISCAGNVMMLPGRTQLTIAGDDIVQKAQNSIDIHASLHDVRLSAARNMEILGGGDEKSSPGGVIIESRGPTVKNWDGEGKGESASVSGITLKTNKQAIVFDAKEVNIRSRSHTRIISGDKDIDGKLSIGAGSIVERAKKIQHSSDGAAISINGGSIWSVGRSIGLYSEYNLNMTKGSQSPVIQWQDTQQNVAADLLPKLLEETKSLSDEKEASGSFGRESLDKMIFGFRTSEECGTNKAWTIGGKGPLKMYEPAWVQVLGIFDTLSDVQKTEYREDAKWSNGMPWPGEEVNGSATYEQLVGLNPRNLTREGFNKSRKDVSEKSEITHVPLKDGYFVAKS